ncbi:MAG: HAD family phosphatase [Candidatus Coatesbacteria bacterium]
MAGNLQAVCFDLDGLLADTEPFYFEAHRQVFAKYGVALTMEEYARRWIILGQRTSGAAPAMGITEDPAVLTLEAKALYREMVRAGVTAMPHAVETMRAVSARFPTILVTNTPEAETRLILEKTGLAPYLHHLAPRESYENPKPAPDSYLAAARILGRAPGGCLAIEDSPRGVRAALAAGMRCVWIPNEYTRVAEPPRGILATLGSLAELDVDSIAARWTSL